MVIPNSATAPATVGGEQGRLTPLGLQNPGKAGQARTRESGDLPRRSPSPGRGARVRATDIPVW